MKIWKSGQTLKVPLSGKLAQAARAHLDHATEQPVLPKYAATVMLVRNAPPRSSSLKTDLTASRSTDDASGGIEVFMLRRAKTMAFVPDAVVFPGGSVDARDSDPKLPWAGPAPSVWAKRMGCQEDLARRIVVAAAREVFEECGVLLAGPHAESVISDLTDPLWDVERDLLSSHAESFAEMLIRRKLVLRSDLLGLRSHWLTPEFEPQRYDTFFFAALLPEGQIPDDRTSEAQTADWVEPTEIYEQAIRGEALLLPPTRYNLAFLADAKSAEAFVTDAPPVGRIMLEPVRNPEGEVLLECILP